MIENGRVRLARVGRTADKNILISKVCLLTGFKYYIRGVNNQNILCFRSALRNFFPASSTSIKWLESSPSLGSPFLPARGALAAGLAGTPDSSSLESP